MFPCIHDLPIRVSQGNRRNSPLRTLIVSASVHSIVPLSLFEALKNLDTPVEDGLQDVAEELVTKRLGLSSTVATQIERYRASADRDGMVSWGEAVSVFRLVGRRPDASLLYADAGRRTARHAARRLAWTTRLMLRLLPGGMRRRMGRRVASVVAREVVGVRLRTSGGGSCVDLTRSLATEAVIEGTGCIFYGSALAELLRLLSGFEGAMVHDTCRARGADQCVWRTATTEGYE